MPHQEWHFWRRVERRRPVSQTCPSPGGYSRSSTGDSLSDLTPKQFKARVVIRGQYMKEGLDFNDTFAPVAKPMTIRAVLAISTKYACKLKAGDVETAFLASDVDCEIWVKMPALWGDGDSEITGHATSSKPRRLLKGVPGIPQASRLFYEIFAAKLKRMGWLPAVADKCLFLNPTLPERTAVILWVDDFIFMHELEETWKSFLKELREQFTVPTVGVLTSFLGMDIKYDSVANTMFISQTNAIDTLLERAKMQECNPSPTPCVTGMTFTKKDCPATADDSKHCTEYRSLIALANFIACWTRPDITFTVNKLCKYMSNPGEVHWKALKHLLRYLKGTRQLGLRYSFATPATVSALHGYTDASHADCPDSGRSTVAYVFYYHGAILSWYSKLHSFVTTSTNHSEYAALGLGAKEAQWMIYLFEQLDPRVKHQPVPIFVDNAGVVSLVLNPVDHQANKHIRVTCHYARELTEGGVIAPQRVPTDQNLADLLTKPVTGGVFKMLVDHFVSASPVSCSRGGVGRLPADLLQFPNGSRRNRVLPWV